MLDKMLACVIALGMTMAWAGAAETVATKGGVQMVKLSGGTFAMGDDKGRADAKPAHQVTVKPFLMDATEVTQEEYIRLMEYNPSKFRGENLPVERVRWTDAAKYCNKRSAEDGLPPVYNLEAGTCNLSANGYRLPTEAEWEYAARGGSAEPQTFTDAALAAIGWFRNNSGDSTHKVGAREANSFGLFDLFGNVAEWCNDWYDATYYADSPAADPAGPAEGKKRVIRGGSWADRAKKIGSSVRGSDNPVTADICQGYDTYGFRCVRNAE